MIKEKWKTVPNTNGKYLVSNHGAIQNKEGRPLRGRNNGYHRVNLKYEDGWRLTYIHRLVAKLFKDNPENKPHINHIDGNKLNNHIRNLEWVTNRENICHAVDNMLHAHGESSGSSVLSKVDILDIRNAYRLGCFTQKEISEAYNVCNTTIWHIVHNRSWTHL